MTARRAWKLVHELQKHSIIFKASNKLAQERGACDYFDRTKYSDGIPIDTYKKDVDTIVENKLNYDWDTPAQTYNSTDYGTAHCPTDVPREQFLVFNAKNGIEPSEDTCPRKAKRVLSRLFQY